MKTSRLLFFALVATSSVQAAVLQVNLGPSGLPAEAGFTDWTTADNNAPTATTISGIGLSLTIQLADTGGLRSIDRTDSYNGILDNLTESWWGVRATSTGSGGQFTIIVNGADLGAGSFDWTSWHHDQDNQSGVMDIEYSVNGGSTFSLGVDDLDIISFDTDANVGAPNPAGFTFVSNGADDIHIRFTNVASNNSGEAFALLNGFQIDEIPEPSSTALLGLGSLGLMLRRRR